MLCLHNVLFPVQLAVLRPLGCAALRFPLKIRLSCSLTKAQTPPKLQRALRDAISTAVPELYLGASTQCHASQSASLTHSVTKR